MSSKRKATMPPVRWQPSPAELGGGHRDGIVEQNLLSQIQGEANQQQVTYEYDRAEASVALRLSLRVGSQEVPVPQSQNRLLQHAHAPTRRGPSLRPPPQLGSNSSRLQLPLPWSPPSEPRCGECSLRYEHLSADLLGRVSADLDRRVGLLRQELGAEVRKEVLRLHAAAGVPRPASAFPAAGLPGGGGAWRWCPACWARPGTVASEPYEHLCLCAPCSADGSRVCLVCSFAWTRGGAVDAAASRGRGGGRRARESSLPPWP